MSTQPVPNFNDAIRASLPPSASSPTRWPYLEVPVLLKDTPNWVGWKLVEREGKATKVPFDVKTGRPAKADDPSTWTTFEQVIKATDILNSDDYAGPGFELGGTNIVGIDFDNAINSEGKIDAFVSEILTLLGNPYTEISPSGTGLHAFVECDALPAGLRKMSKGHDGIEIYHGREGGRYFTITGERVGGSAVPKVDIELPYLLITQNHDERFKSLWLGDVSANDNDDSSADQALCNRLARLLNFDPKKIEAAFSASKLGQRAKWVDRRDYRDRTIKKAIEFAKAHEPKSLKNQIVFHLPQVSKTETNGYDYDYVLDRPLDQSKRNDGWFPRGSVSLVGAPSGASKTTIMYQLLLAQKQQEVFLGHASHGLPFCVLGADRDEEAHERTLLRMGFQPTDIPFEELSGEMWDIEAAQEIVDKIESQPVFPQVVLIEGLDFLVSNIADIKCISVFMRQLQRIAKYYRIVIIGTLGSPKIKAGHAYIAKRDNLLGSVGWGRKCEVIMNLQFPQNDDTASRRKLWVLLRNGKTEYFTLDFENGQLVIVPDSDGKDGPVDLLVREIEWYKNQGEKWWTTTDMERALGMPYSTVARHVGDAYAKQIIKQKTGKKKGKGKAEQYQWNDSKKNPKWVEPTTGVESQLTL